MSNVGIAPPDFTTPIGKLRSLIGDVGYVPLVPPVAGEGDYSNFSDDQLQTFLDLGGGDNLAYGAGYAYSTLAAQFAADAMKVTTDDESIDLTGRADAMRKLADQWFARGDVTAAASNDYFSIVYPEYQRECDTDAELEARTTHWWF